VRVSDVYLNVKPICSLDPSASVQRNKSFDDSKKDKGSPYSITERRVPELIPVLSSKPAGDVNHKPDGRLPVVTPATVKRAATNIAAW